MGRNTRIRFGVGSALLVAALLVTGAQVAAAATTTYAAKVAIQTFVKGFVLGADGTQHVLVDDANSTGSEYLYDSGGSWHAHPFGEQSGDIALDVQGSPVIALLAQPSEQSGPFLLATMSDGGWTVEQVVPGGSGGIPQSRARIAVASDGTIFYAYGAGNGIQYRTKPLAGSWSDATIVDAPTRPTMTSATWDMVLDSSNVPHFIVAGHYPATSIGWPCVVDGGCVVDMVPAGDGWTVTPIGATAGFPDAIDTVVGGLEVILDDGFQISFVAKVAGDWVTRPVATGNTMGARLVRSSIGPTVIYAIQGGVGLRRADQSGSTWANTTIASGSIGFVGAAFDATGRLHVAYSLFRTDGVVGSTADAYVRAPDDVAPTVGQPGTKPKTSATISTTVPATVSWNAADSQSGLDHFQLQQRTDGGIWKTVSSTLTTASTSRTLSLGHRYEFRVRGYDRAGHVSGWQQSLPSTMTRYQETSTRIVYAGTWKSSSSSSASGGKTKYATSATARATITFTGTAFAWVAPKSSSRGLADVWVDGTPMAEVNLNRSSALSKVIVFSMRWSTSGTHTIQIRNLASSGHSRIDIDALVVVR